MNKLASCITSLDMVLTYMSLKSSILFFSYGIDPSVLTVFRISIKHYAALKIVYKKLNIKSVHAKYYPNDVG